MMYVGTALPPALAGPRLTAVVSDPFAAVRCSYAVEVTMTLRSLRIPLACAAALGTAALPAAALGMPVMVHGPKACYVTVDPSAREVIKLRATGFTPLVPIDLFYDGGPRVTSFDSNAAGAVKVREQAPYRGGAERPLTITLREHLHPENAVTAVTRVTALRVRLRPKDADTSDPIRFSGRGFTQHRAIWGHYLFRGRLQKTVRFAPGPATACGTFSVRRRQFPIEHPRPGVWTLQVDQRKRWSPEPKSVVVPVQLRVRRVVRGG
jgi:hypothetical protein